VALSEIDRTLLQRCLERKPNSWNEFVDRFMGLVVHVVNHTADSRSIRLMPHDRDDLAAEVFLAILANDFAVLRHFRGQSSLATYLTVIGRRVVVRELLRRKSVARAGGAGDQDAIENVQDNEPAVEQRLSVREQVERMLSQLDETEADVMRLYHLEGKSYYEISMAIGMPENSVGPMLSRAKSKLRQAHANRTA
jgi:RNA polymerase sigma-70 factor (ECF subfamily)